MNRHTRRFVGVFGLICFLCGGTLSAQVWDFENGNDHGFTLTGLMDGTLPDGGSAWSIGPPDQYQGQPPVVVEGTNIDANGSLDYCCNMPMPVGANSRGQSGYLNTYALSQWGDGLHVATNDQIATSPTFVVPVSGEVQMWSYGSDAQYSAPALDADPAAGYATGSSGLAVRSVSDGSLLASLQLASNGGVDGAPKFDSLDISALAGQEVQLEVVDAFAGGWGWISVDEIRVVPEPTGIVLLLFGVMALGAIGRRRG